MNQFLIDGIMYREVFRDVGTEHEERGGCCPSDGLGYLKLCEECELRKACPADGDDE